jgi:ATP-binding cassette subfamily B protein
MSNDAKAAPAASSARSKKPASTRGNAPQHPMTTLKRTLKLVFSYYHVYSILIVACIIAQATLASLPSIFLQQALAVIGQYWQSGDWVAAEPQLLHIVSTLVICYLVGMGCVIVQTQLTAVVTQGTLMKVRNQMFEHMEDLPIRYFDTNKHGDIMSHYTNDVDTLRQLIGVAFPQILTTGVAMLSVLLIMLWYSLSMTLVVLIMVAFMIWITRFLGSRSAHYFLRQQQELGRAEGFVEEAMNGEKVIKVFTHETETEREFQEVNESLFEASDKANTYGNILGPVLMNLGNVAYVAVALAGGIMLTIGVPSPSISGMALTIDVVIPFLNMTKRFAGSIGQVSNQINFVVMGLAGAERIFDLLGKQPEVDQGYVTLVNFDIDKNGQQKETSQRTDKWAWKHPHKTDGTVNYTPLRGDVRLSDVSFGYEPNHEVLHNISLYAKPGQKVAFVGATGAGKTTITNLINRFYDITGGKIRYDGINIEKIKKDDLRRSLGIVLQDTNLFTGTIMDNIRYGRLDATDEECIGAAKLAGADSFIMRLPEGYQTMLTDNAARLSQGQRQLLSIARAAVADPPVMVLDEATSSIDTRTEMIVQKGMDALMYGRTTFVIAHRLSTVRNADVIIVLDHGRIIERGTHDELIAAKGTYYQLYTGAFELE